MTSQRLRQVIGWEKVESIRVARASSKQEKTWRKTELVVPFNCSCDFALAIFCCLLTCWPAGLLTCGNPPSSPLGLGWPLVLFPEPLLLLPGGHTPFLPHPLPNPFPSSKPNHSPPLPTLLLSGQPRSPWEDQGMEVKRLLFWLLLLRSPVYPKIRVSKHQTPVVSSFSLGSVILNLNNCMFHGVLNGNSVLREDQGPQGRFLDQPEPALAAAVLTIVLALSLLLVSKHSRLYRMKPEIVTLFDQRRKWKCTKSCWVVCQKWMNCMIYELCLNSVIIIFLSKELLLGLKIRLAPGKFVRILLQATQVQGLPLWSVCSCEHTLRICEVWQPCELWYLSSGLVLVC